jgi:hypothetical protein
MNVAALAPPRSIADFEQCQKRPYAEGVEPYFGPETKYGRNTDRNRTETRTKPYRNADETVTKPYPKPYRNRTETAHQKPKPYIPYMALGPWPMAMTKT